jgi:hypothetical protein
MSDPTMFILNGPAAGGIVPYTNAAVIRAEFAPGQEVDYEPAPRWLAPQFGDCLILKGTQIYRLKSGNHCLAHPMAHPTLVHATVGEIKEIEDAPLGHWYEHARPPGLVH